MMTGGPFENFSEGWAVNVFADHRKAHFWKIDEDDDPTIMRTMCSRRRSLVGALRAPGTYEKCRLCSTVYGRVVR